MKAYFTFLFFFTFWQILNEAAVAKICDVDEDIVANWLLMVFIVFGCLLVVGICCWLLDEELVEVAVDVADDEELVGEVE